ncbi:hypothetical protein AAF712_005241 [Marasmius tenuissimus]|uniref:Uncharacterized protein n=1 Tax=Marasmius tenuissimus TaxID=585030 RepID=A0ABR3A385_9AGAR
MGIVLLITAAGTTKWLYPYTVDDLKRQISCIDEVIERNTALGRDLLGDLGWKFRERLAGEHRRMNEIKEWTTVEPERSNLFGWVGFRWRKMRELKKSYCSVTGLKKDVMV